LREEWSFTAVVKATRERIVCLLQGQATRERSDCLLQGQRQHERGVLVYCSGKKISGQLCSVGSSVQWAALLRHHLDFCCSQIRFYFQPHKPDNAEALASCVCEIGWTCMNAGDMHECRTCSVQLSHRHPSSKQQQAGHLLRLRSRNTGRA